MAGPQLCAAQARSEQPSARIEPSGPEGSLQALIDALIDIDVVYEREREAISRSSLDSLKKSQSLKRLREQHWQRRWPYVQTLVALQERA